MPSPTRKASNWTKRGTRQARGYGREHDAMRAQVLFEAPLCRLCTARDIVSATVMADHITRLSGGGTGERSNYQGLRRPCDVAKTALESTASTMRG